MALLVRRGLSGGGRAVPAPSDWPSDWGDWPVFFGGVSAQECVIPDLVIERGQEVISATIAEVTWRGMRCRVAVRTSTPGLTVDLRLNWKQAASSIASSAKELASNGEASLAVSDDKHEGAAASVVVCDATGRVLDYKATTVGET